MPSFETALRLIVIGQELLIAAIFLTGSGARAARVSGAMLVLSVAGYLYNSDLVLRDAVPVLLPVVMLLAMITPYCLWAFARAVFEAPWPKRWVVLLFLSIGAVVWGIFVSRDAVGEFWVNFANIVMHIVSLVIVLHALRLTLVGRPDDLIERRRSFRLFFVVIVSLQVAAVLLVELTLGAAAPPRWLELSNIIIIGILTLGLAIPMLRLNAEFFEVKASAASERQEDETSKLGAAETVLRDKLLGLIDSGYYRETGLTIRVLADQINYPEHQLRRLINGHLGYRNFSAFLNDYRIHEARIQLVDPERARMPVLTIALELGYASLGPFNRAFKAATGMTPSEYRETNLTQDLAISE